MSEPNSPEIPPEAPPPELLLKCPHCGFEEPAPFAHVDLYICANCGRTVETE